MSEPDTPDPEPKPKDRPLPLPLAERRRYWHRTEAPAKEVWTYTDWASI